MFLKINILQSVKRSPVPGRYRACDRRRTVLARPPAAAEFRWCSAVVQRGSAYENGIRPEDSAETEHRLLK